MICSAQVRERVVSDREGEHDLVVPQRGIWGTAGVGGWNIDKCAATSVTQLTVAAGHSSQQTHSIA